MYFKDNDLPTLMLCSCEIFWSGIAFIDIDAAEATTMHSFPSCLLLLIVFQIVSHFIYDLATMYRSTFIVLSYLLDRSNCRKKRD